MHPVDGCAVRRHRGDIHLRICLGVEPGKLVEAVEHDLPGHELSRRVPEIVLGEMEIRKPPLHFLQDALLGEVGNLAVVIRIALAGDSLEYPRQVGLVESRPGPDDVQHDGPRMDDSLGELRLGEGRGMLEDPDALGFRSRRAGKPEKPGENGPEIQARGFPRPSQRAPALLPAEGKAPIKIGEACVELSFLLTREGSAVGGVFRVHMARSSISFDGRHRQRSRGAGGPTPCPASAAGAASFRGSSTGPSASHPTR